MAINWQDVITNVVATVGGGAVLLGAAAWLIKSALTHKLAQDAEVFKTQLQANANANAEIERLKASLQIAAVEHQVRFAKLHEKRAEVIAELYGHLTNLSWQIQDFVLSSENFPRPSQREKFSNLLKDMWNFVRLVEARRIYLPVATATVLDKLVSALKIQLVEAGIYGSIEYPNVQTSEQITSAFTKAYEGFENDIPELKAALEMEFRAILGEASRDSAFPATRRL